MKKKKDSKIVFDPMPEDRFHRQVILIRVVDGDTLDVEIDLGWSTKLKERIRLEGLDTPEINKKAEKKAGQWVKERVEKIIGKNTAITITSLAYDRTGQVRGKYGRTSAVVYLTAEGLCLNEYLLKEKLAWATDEEGHLLEERALSKLTGIPPERRE